MNRIAVRFAVLALVCLAVACSCSERSQPDRIPTATVQAKGRGGGFQEWGSGPDLIYGTSVDPEVLTLWKWSGIRLRKSSERNIGAMLNVAVMTDDRYVGSARQKTGVWAFVARRIQDGKTTALWAKPAGWLFDAVGTSTNGQYAGVVLNEDPVRPLPDYTVHIEKLRIGLLGPKANKIDWLATLSGPAGQAQTIRRLRPSDDGAYVAVAGWYYGAAIVDVRAKKLLWANRPKDEVGMVDIAFSPDSKVVYGGGAEGCVYGMEVSTGKIVSRWFATQSGKSEYGCRISTVAVSPNGKLVAAGTGPEGLAYVWDRQTGKLAKVVRHGDSTILVLSFSPNSKALATFIPGAIKIWDLPDG